MRPQIAWTWLRSDDSAPEAVRQAMRRTMHLLKVLSQRPDLRQAAETLPARDSLPPVSGAADRLYVSSDEIAALCSE